MILTRAWINVTVPDHCAQNRSRSESRDRACDLRFQDTFVIFYAAWLKFYREGMVFYTRSILELMIRKSICQEHNACPKLTSPNLIFSTE